MLYATAVSPSLLCPYRTSKAGYVAISETTENQTPLLDPSKQYHSARLKSSQRDPLAAHILANTVLGIHSRGLYGAHGRSLPFVELTDRMHGDNDSLTSRMC
jgi:hypothetical protein